MLSAIQRDLINFEYTREPLLTQITNSLSGFDAVRNTSDEKILGVFKSDQYICSHTQAIDKVENAFSEMGITPEVTDFNLMKNGANLYVHYRMPPALSIDLGDGLPGVPGSDVLVPEVIVRNGYDGRTMFGLEFGLFRLVCSNGARALVVGNRSTNKRYLGDVDVSVIVAGIREFCETLLIHLKNRITMMVANTAPELQAEVREFVVDSWSNKLISVWDQQIEYAEQEAAEAGKDGVSEWQMYNACSFIISHMMNSYARRRLSEIQLAKQFRMTVRSNENMEVDPMVENN
jgi:hypothetical protein